MISKKVLALAGLSALALSREGRVRLRSLAVSARQAARRRRLKLPSGVEEFPSALVDKRHTREQQGHVAAADSAVDIITEHYQEHPAQT